jgi:transmembrane sensor
MLRRESVVSEIAQSPHDRAADGGLSLLEQQAHGWVRRLASGEATAADAEALHAWCAASPENAAAFSEASQYWQAFSLAGQRLLADERAARAAQGPELLGRRVVLGGALAASAAGFLIARPPLGLWPSFAELRADYRTGIGERRQIAADNGVAMQLNSRTSISVGPGGDPDAIDLIAGEASFAAVDRHQPFRVIAAGGQVSAVNARFDMRLIGSGACVTCMAEAVRVEKRDAVAILARNQRVSYDERGLGPVTAIDPAVAAAWRDGLMIFNMTPLAEVIDELNRYRSGRIVLLKSDLAQAPVNGRFRIDRPDEALLQIERAFGVHRRTLGGLVLLS